MTDMLKKSEKTNTSDAYVKSDNLTEQWDKGELPSGWYYVRLIRGEYRIDLYINGKNEWIDCPDNIIDTVVCEVPSYEEWRTSYNCMLENEVLRLKNAQLKELLKEVLRHDLSLKEISELTRKISEVLGEE